MKYKIEHGVLPNTEAMRAYINKPGHMLHGREVFVEWVKVAEDGKVTMVVTDADDPFEFIEIEEQYVLPMLSAQERKDKLIVTLISSAIYALISIAFVAWMVGVFK